MKKQEEEKPFDVVMSRKQQKFLKEIKNDLNGFISSIENADIEDDIKDEDMMAYFTAKALFKLPLPEQNLFLIKTYGQYKSATELSEEIKITKQTITSHLRKSKKFIKDYVTAKTGKTMKN